MRGKRVSPQVAAYRTDDEALRSGTDEIERIAGDERQRALGRRVKHRDIVRVDDPRPLDPVLLRPVKCFELDRIAGGDIHQAPEEAVAMPGDPGVSVDARHGRLFDVADRSIQREFVGAFEHGHFEADTRNTQDRERRWSRQIPCALPRIDPR